MFVMKKFVHQVVKVDDYDNVMHCRDDLAHISISQQFIRSDIVSEANMNHFCNAFNHKQ